jgi:tetratricopeptide (TPR) repeat protein
MRRPYFIIILLTLASISSAQAQNKTMPTPTPTAQRSQAKPSATPPPQQQQSQPRQTVFDLSEVGVQIRPEPRLIVMMAALDAAGFDPTPQGEEPAVFRAQLRKDQANLDPDLRQRLVAFYRRNKLLGPDGKELPPVEQAARYVSLVYALGSAPSFEEPPRSDDLPAGLLEVMDFTPLLREFYRKSGIDERMPTYLRSYQVEGDRLRRASVEMVRGVLSYLNTRPVTTTIERIPVKAPTTTGGRKKDVPMKYETREHERRFFIVPDLLAAPGAINFRVVADDYFITVPYCDETKHFCAGRDNNPISPEVRRAYIQYVIDPLVQRFTRDIAARREQVKLLLDERTKAGAQVSPDVFRTIARSLSTAADVRLEEVMRLDALSSNARSRLDKTTDAAKRAEIIKELETARAALADETIAKLAEGYESGAVLDFYFAEQLRGVESSGFDIGNSLPDMIASFDATREMRRLEEADAARKRVAAAREAREKQGETATTALASLPNAALVKKLLEVDSLVQLKNYAAAEERLLALLREFPGEPRIFFSLAETASFSARDATDEDVQSARLNKALANYRNAVSRATDDTDRCMLLRAHEAMGRILEFLGRNDEALKEFDAAIQINDTSCEAYNKAVEEKKKLSQRQ